MLRFPEKLIPECFSRCLVRRFFVLRLLEPEIIAEVGPVFLLHLVRLWFAAFIRPYRIVKCAVEADVEVGPA